MKLFEFLDTILSIVNKILEFINLNRNKLSTRGNQANLSKNDLDINFAFVFATECILVAFISTTLIQIVI